MYPKIASFLLFSGLSFSAFSAELSHPLLLDLQSQGMSVTTSESLPEVPGLTSWLLNDSVKGYETIVFTTLDQRYLLSAEIVDHGGIDPITSWLATNKLQKGDSESYTAMNQILTENGLEPLTPKVAPSINMEGDLLWAALGESLYINPSDEDIDNNKILYVFVDPNCVNCAKLWPYQQERQGNGITFRLIPVSFNKPEDGYKKMTSMFLAEDPYLAYGINNQLFSQGGYPGVSQANQDVTDRMELNFKLMQKLKIQGTPSILYQNNEGETRLANTIDVQFLDEMAAQR